MKFNKPKYTTRLFPSSKPYYMDKDRESGERDLENLADSEVYEGAWLYSPEKQQWYNFGNEISEDEVRMLTTRNLSTFGKRLSHYHTHQTNGKIKRERKERTTKIFLARLKNNPDNNYSALERVINARALTKELYGKGGSFPSEQDINLYFALSKKNPECELDFNIATSRGTLTLRINKNLDLSRITNRHIRSISRRYRDVRDRAIATIDEPTMIPNALIYGLIGSINKSMGRLFTVSMKYRTP